MAAVRGRRVPVGVSGPRGARRGSGRGVLELRGGWLRGEPCLGRGGRVRRPGLDAGFIFTVGQGSAGWSYLPLPSV